MTTEPVVTPASWAAFIAWALIGAGFSLGILSILTIGILVLAVTAVATIALVRWRNGRSGAPGVIAGVALPLFYVAYLNRGGPGSVCTTDGDVSQCTEAWSPWPFVVLGLIFLAAGAIAFVAMNRGHSAAGPGASPQASA